MIRPPLTPDPLPYETLALQHVEASHVVLSPLQGVPLPLFSVGSEQEKVPVSHVAAASKAPAESTSTGAGPLLKKVEEVKT